MENPFRKNHEKHPRGMREVGERPKPEKAIRNQRLS
jgi:hypothetical protein